MSFPTKNSKHLLSANLAKEASIDAALAAVLLKLHGILTIEEDEEETAPLKTMSMYKIWSIGFKKWGTYQQIWLVCLDVMEGLSHHHPCLVHSSNALFARHSRQDETMTIQEGFQFIQ